MISFKEGVLKTKTWVFLWINLYIPYCYNLRSIESFTDFNDILEFIW